MRTFVTRLIFFCVLALSMAPTVCLAEATNAPFPRPLNSYDDGHLGTFFEVILHRAALEPLNIVTAALFLLAIIHIFYASRLMEWSERIEESDRQKRGAQRSEDEGISFRAMCLHYLGEIEAVFGIWAIPLIALIAWSKGLHTARAYLEHGVHYTEAVFVVVIMAVASSRPVLRFAERCLSSIAQFGHSTPVAWWMTILICGPLLGSFITEPAAMTISAILLSQRFYRYKVSPNLAYATMGLLFVNISVGGVLTHFAAPPVIMVAGKWGWGTVHMLTEFGWKAFIGILTSTSLYYWLFRRELHLLGREETATAGDEPVRRPIPAAVIVGNLIFLVGVVLVADSAIFIVIAFLFFTAYVDATRRYQPAVALRSPLLVGFFLAGLVVHGGLQGWWIEPLLSRLSEPTLLLSSIALTAFNDNAAITFLATLVPEFSDGLKYAVVAGAVTGGGLTIIANAPNPAGYSILSRYFPNGLSPRKLVMAALPPTIINALLFLSFR